MKKVIGYMLIVGLCFLLAPAITLADSGYSSWGSLGVARGNADNSTDGSQEILVALNGVGYLLILAYDWDDSAGMTNSRTVGGWGVPSGILDIAVGDADNDGDEDILVAWDARQFGLGYAIFAYEWDGYSIVSGTLVGTWGVRFIGIGVGNADNSTDGSQEVVVAFDTGGGTTSILAYTWDGTGITHRWVAALPLGSVHAIEVENTDNSADGSQEIVISHGSYTQVYSWDGTDYGSTFVGNKINLPMPFLYDLGYAAGYNDGRDDVLEILPPGIKKNVEAERGFAK